MKEIEGERAGKSRIARKAMTQQELRKLVRANSKANGTSCSKSYLDYMVDQLEASGVSTPDQVVPGMKAAWQRLQGLWTQPICNARRFPFTSAKGKADPAAEVAD